MHALFLDDDAKRRMYFHVDGAPLLLDYVGTPSPFGAGALPVSDSRFSVRAVTGFLYDQPPLLADQARLLSKDGFWSWEDRGRAVTSMWGGKPEAMVVNAAWRGDPSKATAPFDSPWSIPQGRATRDGGATFRARLQQAVDARVKLMVVQSFNEFLTANEEFDLERSNDIEPTAQTGMTYMQLLQDYAVAFKQAQGSNAYTCPLTVSG